MTNRPKFRELLKKKEIEKGKETQLEKNDFLALLIAGFSVFLPAILIFIAFMGLLIWLFTVIFH